MPLGDGLLWIDVELSVARMRLDFHPRSPGSEHQVGVLRRYWQRGVDGRCKRMDQIWPFGTEQPQPRAAQRAEMPLGGAATGALVAVVLEPRMVNRDVLATAYFQAGGIAPEVDRITAAALGLAADR